MKLRIILWFVGFISFLSHAQNIQEKVDDLGRIAIVPFISNQVESIPMSAVNKLQSKMAQLLTSQGIAGSTISLSQFVITPNISVLSKEVVAGAPPKVALVLEVAFYIGDGISGIKFGSAAVTVKGVGTNENKAYLSAFKNIDVNNAQLVQLIDTAKKRILAYYNDGCDFILKEADNLAKQDKFDEALYMLSSIPVVSKDCFNTAQDRIGGIYKHKIDRDCDILLNQATNAWNMSQDFEAAEKAAIFLNQIEPDSKCYFKVKALSVVIQKGLKMNTDRAWSFIDKQLKSITEIEKSKSDTMKEIALAYAKSMPQNLVYNVKGWW